MSTWSCQTWTCRVHMNALSGETSQFSSLSWTLGIGGVGMALFTLTCHISHSWRGRSSPNIWVCVSSKAVFLLHFIIYFVAFKCVRYWEQFTLTHILIEFMYLGFWTHIKNNTVWVVRNLLRCFYDSWKKACDFLFYVELFYWNLMCLWRLAARCAFDFKKYRESSANA